MNANIEALVKKHAGTLWLHETPIRNALTELSETHALELRAYETTVANLEGRIQVISDALTGLVAIAHDSDGVAGYHKNGDIADWYSFPEFEAAVIAIDAAAPAQEKV